MLTKTLFEITFVQGIKERQARLRFTGGSPVQLTSQFLGKYQVTKNGSIMTLTRGKSS